MLAAEVDHHGRRPARSASAAAADLLHRVRLPDQPAGRLFGVSLDQQARTSTRATGSPTRTATSRSVAQYELRDEATLRRSRPACASYDGRAKPAFDAYRLPIWVTRSGTGVSGLGPGAPGRRRRAGGRRDPERPGRQRLSRPWPRSGPPTPRASSTPPRRRNGTWRLRWTPRDGGPTLTSRTAASERPGGRRGAPRGAPRRPGCRARPTGRRRGVARPRGRDRRRRGVPAPAPSRPRRSSRAGSQLGIDVARVHARWCDPPRPHDRRPPQEFNAANPEDPHYDWASFDLAVKLLRRNGIRPMVSITGSGPAMDEPEPCATQPAMEARPCAVRGLRQRGRPPL